MPYDWARLLFVLAEKDEPHPSDPALTAASPRTDGGGHPTLGKLPSSPVDGVMVDEAIEEMFGPTTSSEKEGREQPDLRWHDRFLAGELPDPLEAIRLEKTDLAPFDRLGDESNLAKQIEAAVDKYRGEMRALFNKQRGWTGTSKQIGQRSAKTAKGVLSILESAAEHGFGVRFFDPDRALAVAMENSAAAPPPWFDQGLPGWMTILNARQVQFQPPALEVGGRARRIAFASRLTSQNRRALATFAWPTLVDHHPPAYIGEGAIVWSDTEHTLIGKAPGRDVVPWPLVGVMSAPHHASRDDFHADIWRHRPPHVRVLLSHNQHPDTSEFLELAPSECDCTKCASFPEPGHEVGWSSGGGHRGWGRGSGLRGQCRDDHVRRPWER